MNSTLTSSPAADVLESLFADAAAQRANPQASKSPSVNAATASKTPYERYEAAKSLYMPIDRPFGNLLYSIIRASRPTNIVEFGTSFGISTIFLAAAVKDNGTGIVTTTEYFDEKIAVARKNLLEAGLVDQIDFRSGDALQSLKRPLPGPVDLLFLDGEKSMYLDVVRLLEPQMKSGCLVISDNTDQEGAASYLDYIRNPHNGYVTSALLTTGGSKQESGHEISVRL